MANVPDAATAAVKGEEVVERIKEIEVSRGKRGGKKAQ